MALKSHENSIGAWAFLIGVVLCVLFGLSTKLIPIPFFTAYSVEIYAMLLILGIIVGFMNLTVSDSQTFMIAGAVIVVVSKFGMEGVYGSLIGVGMGSTMSTIFAAFLALFVPATIIMAIKTLFSIANV